MNELLRLIKVKDVPAGEAKMRVDVGASLYAIGVDVRVTVWTKELTLGVGAPLFKV